MFPCKPTVAALACACSLASPGAGATGLGEIRILSPLGAPFRAEIPLLKPSASTAFACFSLTTRSPDGIDDLPWLEGGRVTLLADPPRLVISSHRPVGDPAVQLAVLAACGVNLTRHYVALLSPGDEQPGLATAAGPAPRAAPAPAAAGSARPSAARAEMPPAARDRQASPKPAVRAAPAPRPKADAPSPGTGGRDRLLLSPSEPLPAPATLPVTQGEIDTRLGDVENQIRTLRAQLGSLRSENPMPAPAVETLLLEMETRLMAVELNAARIKLATLAASAPAPLAAAQPAAAAEAKDAGAAPALPVAPATPEPPAAAPAPMATPAAAPAAAREPEVAAAPQIFDFGLGLALLGGFGLGLGAFLYRRTLRDGAAPNPVDAAAAVRVMPAPQAVHPRPAAIAPAADVAAAPVGGGQDARFEEVGERDDSIGSIALADILLAFGRTRGAVEVLEESIEENPDESLQPGMYLLDVYRQTDMRREFEQLADRLAKRFNVQRIDWDEPTLAATSAGACAPAEGMPSHIRSRIAATWGSGECLDYLRGLLADTRDGQRKGFSLAVTREILGLIKTLEERIRSGKGHAQDEFRESLPALD